MNTLDIAVFAVLALSGLTAFILGFVRLTLVTASWAGAALAAYYLRLPAQPIFRQFITLTWVADLVGPVVIFVVALMILSIATNIIANRTRRLGLGAADHVLGLGFGVASAAIVLCAIFLVTESLVGKTDWPSWVTQAKSLPLLQTGAAKIASLLPPQLIEQSQDTLKDIGKKADAAQTLSEPLSPSPPPGTIAPAPPQTPAGQPNSQTSPNSQTPPPGQQQTRNTAGAGYTANDRNGMNALIQGSN